MSLAKLSLQKGGEIIPLHVDNTQTQGLGVTNPSVLVLGEEILVNIRNVKYNLFHSIGAQHYMDEGGKYQSKWGPMSYIHRDADRFLVTENFLASFTKDFKENYTMKIDTSKHDVEPKWLFHGLEDGRLVKWNNNLYLIGVRRDTNDNGIGRMEYSKLEVRKDRVIETERISIMPPVGRETEVEKNWMPVIDMPNYFIRWSNPTELVKVDLRNRIANVALDTGEWQQHYGQLRGSSQVIRWKNCWIAIVHDTNYWYFYDRGDANKDAFYFHKLIAWDNQWNLIHVSNPFKFMNGQVEFCCGADKLGDDLLITTGFEDNAGFLLKVPESVIDWMLEDERHIP